MKYLIERDARKIILGDRKMKECKHCMKLNNSDSQFCQHCGHKLEINETSQNEVKSNKSIARQWLQILILVIVGVILVTFLVNRLSIDHTVDMEVQNVSGDDLNDDEESSEPKLLYATESKYHGDLNGYKSYEDSNSYTYEKNYETLEDLLGDATGSSIPPLSSVLTKVKEPIVFYVTNSYRATTMANVHNVLIFHNDEVTTYSFHPNKYDESNPETVLTITDFIGKSVSEVIEIADQNQRTLFELTRNEILSENQDDANLIYQYSQMEYLSPKPQPFELLFSEQYDGQLIRKYAKIKLENKKYSTDLMNEQLESFNDYEVTYNLLLEDRYRSIEPKHNIYLLGFKTNESSLVTIYDGRYGKGFRFDNENTSGIKTENVRLSW